MRDIFENIKKYNYWDGQSFSTGYKRTEYLNRITRYLGSDLIKVLTGQRRTGKSYIMRQIIEKLIHEQGISPSYIFYLNKEYTAFDEIRTAADLEKLFTHYLRELSPRGKVYIFIDEIQEIESWENFVNSYAQDYTSEYELIITGSNSNLLAGELSGRLSGRYIEFSIFPFSFSEYAGIKNAETDRNLFNKYLRTGGLPELMHLNDEEIERHYLESLKSTIILRDIATRYSIKDLSLLEEIFAFMIQNIGSLTSVTSVIKYFKSRQKKTNYETIANYIGYLCSTFTFHQAERYNIRGKQLLGGERKYYLNDLSFKNYLYGFYPEDAGYNLENFIFMELKRAGYKINVGVMDKNEIDFIATSEKQTIYIQSAYLLNSEDTVKREFGNLLRIKDNHKKIIVSMDEFKFDNREGIIHLWPWELGNIL